AARMGTAEGATPILQCGKVSFGRNPVVDRRSGVESDLKHEPRVRDVSPPSPAADGSCIRPKKRSEAVEFGIAMETLAKEQCVAGAVRDVVQVIFTVEVEDPVP